MSDLARYYDQSYPPSLWAGSGGPVAPTLATIAPTTSPVASQPFTLTATGTGITATTQIVIDGAPKTTTYVSGTQCTTSVSGLTTGVHTVGLREGTATSALQNLTITATGLQTATSESEDDASASADVPTVADVEPA